jgi:two-component system, LytTR family, sensor histidine kinase AlgZ
VPAPSLLRSTLRALLAPRRALAIVVITVPLLAAQIRLSVDPLAGPIGALMCLSFVLLGPLSWRALFPIGEARPPTFAAPFGRHIVYGTTAAGTVAIVGVIIPGMLAVGDTFMTSDVSLLVSMALFWVGGYGLGRDIDLELGLRDAHAQVVSLSRQAEHARLLALRSQLDPHFLFNTLNAIAEWCREDGEVAERATLRLSEMLRTILVASRRAAWPLADELALCRTLFELHLVRDPGRFSLRERIDPALPQLEVPPMILLPLCENAMKHGPGAGHGGEVELGAELLADGVALWVENPGRFIGPRPGGEGIELVRQRLDHAYVGRAHLEVAAHGDRTHARIVLPLRARPEHEA